MTETAHPRPVDADHLGNSYSPDLRGRRDRSIFDVDTHWRRGLSPLPSILVTEPTMESRAIENDEALYTTPHGGRFPILRFPDDSPQPAAAVARSFGYGMYYEGICTPALDNLGKRIDCFRAAELLYLHAIARGDMRAHSGLGIIYMRDYAEGHYFDALGNNLFANLVLDADEISAKAYQHLQYAAAHGDLEGLYLFGDALREGVGCDIDRDNAFLQYQKAWTCAQQQKNPTNAFLGTIAWRLGRAYEEGEGCACDYEAALRWYETARTNLELAVDNGAWFLDVELGQSIRGVKRMRQEQTLRADAL